MFLKLVRQHVMWVAWLVAAWGCASAEPQMRVARAGRSTSVDPAKDNRATLEQLTPGLLIHIQIDGNRVAISDLELMQVPRVARNPQGGELVSVSGLRGRERISTVLVPDARVNVQEHVGIVLRDQRTLNVVLPTPSRIDSIQIALPGQAAQSFDVAPVFERICHAQPQAQFCR